MKGPAPRPSRVRKMTVVEAAWVGAMLEGEGCIRTYRRTTNRGTHWHPEVTIGSTEVETIATILRLVGDGGVYFRPRVTPTRRPMWVWTLGAQAALHDLLSQVMEFLTSKREDAEVLLVHARRV